VSEGESKEKGQLPVYQSDRILRERQVSLELPPPESPDDSLEVRVKQAVAQLGLKLESRKVGVTFLVVDAASKTPTEN
jgi:uncharacterized protein (TIGR03435 family)